MLKKQADKKAIERIQRIFAKLETQSDIEGKPRSPLEATLIMNSITIEGLLDCQEGVEKELNDLTSRLTRLEERNKILTSIGSKVGLTVLGVLFTGITGALLWVLKELLKLKMQMP